MKKENKKEEELHIADLRKKRCLLLEEIHKKQQELDRIDYRIYQYKEKIKT